MKYACKRKPIYQSIHKVVWDNIALFTTHLLIYWFTAALNFDYKLWCAKYFFNNDVDQCCFFLSSTLLPFICYDLADGHREVTNWPRGWSMSPIKTHSYQVICYLLKYLYLSFHKKYFQISFLLIRYSASRKSLSKLFKVVWGIGSFFAAFH